MPRVPVMRRTEWAEDSDVSSAIADPSWRTQSAARSLDVAFELPPELDAACYQAIHSDLHVLAPEQLAAHYRCHGEREGRRSNRLESREAFAGLVPAAAAALEIGPFFKPLLRGPRVRYFDVGARADLERRARSLGFSTEHIPEIDFVSTDGDLGIVGDRFDAVLSSHAIEHQPDLVGHLRAVERLLRPGGCYFVLAPDKAYCFDHFIPESAIAEVVEAHLEGRRRHGLRKVIAYRAQTTHNDPARHWRGDHGSIQGRLKDGLARAMRDLEAANGGYLDVHSWYFRPASFRALIDGLRELELITLELLRLYPTRRGCNEFWAVLRRPLGCRE